MENDKTISFRIGKGDYAKLQQKAKEQDRSVSSLVRVLIKQEINK